MTNTQRPEPRIASNGDTLEVHSIFYTIQGEGPFAGCPAVFIRLTGCNMQCPGCDTEYTSRRERMPVDDVVGQAMALFAAHGAKGDLVVLTGGEPFRQNISVLCHELLAEGLTVQVETNGTLAPSPNLSEDVIVVCSPKAGKVAPDLLQWVSAYKYVMDANEVSPQDGLPTAILGKAQAPARPHVDFHGGVYLSPMDSKNPAENERNTQAAVHSCMTYGYTLNLQLHKFIGLP